MTSPALIRPPRVTTACLFFATMCVLLLIEAGSALSDWGSLEVQESIETVLSDKGLRSLDLTVDEVMGWLRLALIVMCAIAAAGVVFAIYAAQGHQASRVIVTVLLAASGVMFLFVGPLGFILAAFAAFSATYLWTADARQWFAAKNGKIDLPPMDAGARPDPFAQAAVPPAPEAQPVTAMPIQPRTGRRPSAVQTAGLITLIGSVFALLMAGLALLTFLTSRDEVLRMYAESSAWQQMGFTAAETADAIDNATVICAVVVALSAVAIGAAITLLMNKKIGRLATLVMAYVSVPVGVLTIVGLPWAASAVVVAYQLQKAEVRSWFAASR